MFSFPGNDPWVVVLIPDPRAAMAGARKLRGAERHVDGPFVVWDGKVGIVPVSILVTEPEGPATWYAATRLAVRRFSPTLVAGVTRLWWCGPAPAPGTVLGSGVVDLEKIEPILRRVEATAVERLPVRVTREVGQPDLPYYSSEPEAAIFESLFLGKEAVGVSETRRPAPGDQKRVEKAAGRRGSYQEKGLSVCRLGCWGEGRFENRAVARYLHDRHGIGAVDGGSAGLAEAARESGISWFVFGSCRPLQDAFGTKTPSRSLESRAEQEHTASLKEALFRFFEILSTSERNPNESES